MVQEKHPTTQKQYWKQQLSLTALVGTPRVYAEQDLCICRASVRLSVPTWATATNVAAVALLAGDIDRLLHGTQQTSCHVVSVTSTL